MKRKEEEINESGNEMLVKRERERSRWKLKVRLVFFFYWLFFLFYKNIKKNVKCCWLENILYVYYKKKAKF